VKITQITVAEREKLRPKSEECSNYGRRKKEEQGKVLAGVTPLTMWPKVTIQKTLSHKSN
jgi:hypothetical protein